MKNIGIYFSPSGKMAYPFTISQYYESYQELISIIEHDKNTKVFIVRGQSYEGKGIFSEAYFFQDGILTATETKTKVDLIFNRGRIDTIDDCLVINSPSFYEICKDKYKTYLKFPEVSSPTQYIHKYSDLSGAIHNLNIQPDNLVVLKKNFNSGGKDIHIIPAESIGETLYSNWNNILVQKFIDSSVGVPNIVEGLHDLRVMVVNHTIIGATVRTPKQGSFLANVAQGGTSLSLDIQLIPRELLDVLDTVMDHLDDYENIIYGADFMNSPDGYKLVELNACPGLLHKSWDKNCRNFYNAIAKMLLGAIKKL